MSRLPEGFIEKVLNATDIVDLISQHTELRRSGRDLSGLCPLPGHREKTPSFSVSDSKQVYHCFGCKRGGNAINFLVETRGVGKFEAIEMLAERANISIPRDGDSEAYDARADERKKIIKANRYAAKFFHETYNTLPENHPVRKYVLNRGLSAETVDVFKIGYAPDGWESLVEYFESVKAPLQVAEKAGLVRARTKGKDGYYDLFRSRLIFPIISPTDEVLGFGGRILGEGNPKYLNSPDSQVFHKGRVLYGLNQSGKFLRSEDSVVVVEGYMDFLALWQAGIRNVVATLGTALTPDHARLLKRYTHNVTVLFDGDQAGQMASERSLPILLEQGLLPKGLVLPDKLDPDEFILTHGAQALKDRITGADDLFLTIFAQLIEKFGTAPTARVQVLNAITPILERIADSRLSEIYRQEVSNRLGVEKRLVQRSKVPKSEVGFEKPPETKDLWKSVPPHERTLLNLVLAQEFFIQKLIEADVLEMVVHPGVKKALENAVDRYRQNPKDFDRLTAYLASTVQEPGGLTEHLDDRRFGLNEEDGWRLMRDCLHRVGKNFQKTQARQALNEFKAHQDADKLEQFVNILKTQHGKEQ